ncbi:aa3-type cytochrome c oxidase subunit IV [Thalassorhabdomicrobium marinisediminis]|uniref:Aa3-type cytochrome c oxidase subunit IV n=1 Tax=Thalassorhabdomicrobium marinisediminis TaxID=2170577 RepID=A0A2T7FYU9_9RHOB|nr:aa3-type cytochrome c oxidase subunit IV [Thalassorhabdomicrobium marinisediminis]PVA07346.1 aa3-type cytochrome c oxidase subunit IV [Thalassorhabdomicrobium marinisediminis]
MADHKHGEMDIEVQEKTFQGFLTLSARAAIAVIVALILLALINA